MTNDDNWDNANRTNAIAHLRRLQEMIRKFNEINGTNVSMNDCRVYTPSAQSMLNYEGRDIAFVSSDPRVIQAANASTRPKFFNELIRSSPPVDGGNKSEVTEIMYSNVLEALRNAQGDSQAAVALTKDALKGNSTYYRDARTGLMVPADQGGKNWSGQSKIVGRNDQIDPESPTEFPAFASSMELRFESLEDFQRWWDLNGSSVKIQGKPVMDDLRTVRVTISSPYQNSSGTSITAEIPGGGPWKNAKNRIR
jgi:hypothetical protein